MQKDGKQIENNILVSIVVPIYNVDRYLEDCLRSLSRQTHKNLEIILVDDGSTDKSKDICKDWVNKDTRFYYFYQHNQGPGSARNRGIALTTGEYITFVDSDDWVSDDYIKQLLGAMNDRKDDIVRGTIQKVDQKTHKYLEKIYAKYNDKLNVLHYIAPHIAGNLYKRELFEHNQIQMPLGYYEDMATYPILALIAQKISYVEFPIYFYRCNTGKSIMSNMNNIKGYPEAFLYMIAIGKERGIFEKNKDLFFKIILWHMRIALKKSGRNDSKENYNKLKEKFIVILNQNFVGWNKRYQKKIICFGSYNLSQVAWAHTLEYDLLRGDDRSFFCFSSIVSLMNNECKKIKIVHSNIFRQKMIQKEMKKDFLKCGKLKGDIILIDFLEERYDLFQIEGNAYLTKSEALLETDFKEEQYKIVKRTDPICTHLWKESCLKFIDFLKTCCNEQEIYLLKLYLTKGEKQGKNVIEINQVLQEYYQYFEENYGDIKTIELPERLSYTDWNDIFASGPWYLNKEAFVYLAEKF